MKIDGRRERSKATRDAIIEAAIRLTAAQGAHALTMSEVAREAQINRTTAYQFFKGRDELLAAVRDHISGEMLAPLAAFSNIDQITQYVMKHREAMRTWASRLVVGEGLTDDSWVWDRLLENIGNLAANRSIRADVDKEALAAILLVASVIGPLVFQGAVEQGATAQRDAMRRYSTELEKLLHGGLWDQPGDQTDAASPVVERPGMGVP